MGLMLQKRNEFYREGRKVVTFQGQGAPAGDLFLTIHSFGNENEVVKDSPHKMS